MKKAFSFLFLLLSLLYVAPQTQAQSKQDFQTETRPVTAFTGLNVSGGFEVVLTQGSTESLRLEAEEDVLPLIESKVEDGMLHIKMKSTLKKSKHLKAYVTVRNLQDLQLAGGIKLASTNTISGEALKLECAGGINLQLALQVKELTAECAGGNKLTLSGRADKVNVEFAGACTLRALDLKTDYFSLEAAGAHNLDVNVAKELTVDAAGIANVNYKGSPKISHSGIGKVRPL